MGHWPIESSNLSLSTSEDSTRLSPGGLGSSPWLYIQSEARQDIPFHLQPGPSAVRAVVGTQSRLRFAGPEVGCVTAGFGWSPTTTTERRRVGGRDFSIAPNWQMGPRKRIQRAGLVKRGS